MVLGGELLDTSLLQQIQRTFELQSVPELIENSLWNVNKIKRLEFFTDAAPHIFRMKQIRLGSNVDAHPSHRRCEKPSKIGSQAILSTRKMFGAALVNNCSLLILFTFRIHLGFNQLLSTV